MKDYHKKKFQNPFFGKSKSGLAGRGRGFYYGRGPLEFKSLRKKLVFLFLLAAIGGWIHFLFYSPYFWIQKIEISGLEKISKKEMGEIINSQIAGRWFFVLQRKNIFLFDEKSLEKNINSKYALETLKIDKKLPNTLRVSVKEKSPVLIWKTGEKFYHVDQNGVIIYELPSEWQKINLADLEMPIVFDEDNQTARVKETIFAKEVVQFIIDLRKEVAERVGLKIANFKMKNRQSNFIKAATNEGWESYFASDQDLIPQVGKLNIFLKDKKEDERKKLEYIDLRFEDRVYYK